MTERPKSPAELEKMLKDMESMSKGIQETPKARSEKGALKSLLGFFVKIHDDEEETSNPQPPPQTPQPAKPNQTLPTPPMSSPPMAEVAQRRVADIAANEPIPKFNQPKTSVQEEDLSTKPFEEIYKEAGVLKAKCSIDELLGLMNSPTVANQPLTVKVVAVNLALTAKGVKIDDYIADAIRKDCALDAYQLMLNERAAEIETKAKTSIENIQKEVEDYLKKKQQEMEKLRAQSSEASRQSIEFAINRQVEEQRLADAISPFLEGKPNPVSIGNTPERS
ncbi:MAG: hypothetical protein HY819_01735 [Acidobacteria bacterium]|nr:hypothetical protein [Acidobacteriota bacterium]